MKKYKTNVEKYVKNMSRFKHKCECGHIVYLNEKHSKTICRWCGRMNYYDKKEKFKNILKNALKK